jgi:hypothetical protein
MTMRHIAPALFVGAMAGACLAQEPRPNDWPLIAKVLKHPRCLNCHTNTQFPRQGDDRHRHQQLVMRGARNEGAPTLRCSTCHQRANSADRKVPGAPHWQLAPPWDGKDSMTGNCASRPKTPARTAIAMRKRCCTT